MADAAVKELLAINDDAAWKLREKKGIQVGWMNSPKPDSPIVMVKGEGVLDASLDAVSAVVFTKTTEEMKASMAVQDPMMKDGIQELVGEDVWSAGVFSLGVIGVADRVFYWKETRVELSPTKRVCMATRLDAWDKFPAPKGSVVGEMEYTGIILEAVDDSHTRMTYILQVDPKGWLPKTVVNFVALEQADVVLRWKQHFEGAAK